MEFFSVDRRGFYQVGAELNLMPADIANRPLWNLPGWFSEVELSDHLNELYPEGLSYHGWQYLLDRHDFVRPNNQNISYVNHEIAVELLFEFVRKADFPQRKSRFQSFFAWETIEQAREFRVNNQPIYMLDCENYFRADQSLLTYGVQNIAAAFCAKKYWSGESTNNPRWEVLLEPPVRIIERVE